MYWPCGVPQTFAHHGTKGVIINGQDLDGNTNGVRADEAPTEANSDRILDLSTTRNDHLVASCTSSSLSIWSTRPTVILASFTRSEKSLETYGQNKSIVFKSDASVVAVHTALGYLITFAIESDQNSRVLQQHHGHSQSRRQSDIRHFGIDESAGLGELLLRFRRAIKIDAGINSVIATENEIIVATVKPAAVQCIRWEPPKDGQQAVAQLLSKLDWMGKTSVLSMAYDRAMNLIVWIGADGSVYAAQRARPKPIRSGSPEDSVQSSKAATASSLRLFDGYCFHKQDDGKSVLAAINARFSLIALALFDGRVYCYAAKDYVGNIPLSHTFRSSPSASTTGDITSLKWSPDGYCLFVGYEHGWSTFSVFGKEGASSFGCNLPHAESNGDEWLLGVSSSVWTSNGAELIIASGDDRLWRLEMSRSAAMGCFSCANLVRALLQTPSEVMIYRGHELPDLTSISNEASLWHHAQFPATYLSNQHPIKSCVVSQDGRYVAVAGRRGLAHYSINSGRWKTFSDTATESSFAVRGGMCWFNHILAVATEDGAGYDLRLYSRELDLGRNPLHAESFSMPIVFVGPSGDDSLLVYTHENILYHYIIDITEHRAQLVQVGQIAFHGVVRAPGRVRSVSWVVPDSQLRNGDPSRDVEFASVLFLVDDKLVLLQPSRGTEDELKYDLRVIAQHVEYYILTRDQIYFNFNSTDESAPPTPSPGAILDGSHSQAHYSLRDSLWIFSGSDLRLWPDVREVLHHAADGDLTVAAPLLSVPVDFYPLSILLTKGVVLGIEGELLQRRNVNFAQWRTSIRTQLFLPYVLNHQLLTADDTSAAFSVANQYQHLSYFPHALEILLHHILDAEHDRKAKIKSKSKTNIKEKTPLEPPEPLPAVLSFLQMVLSPTTYLSTIVSCVRKTELSFWQTLFDHLDPPLTLFEQALELEDLKTASGFLIILQGLEDEGDGDADDDTAEADTFADPRKFENHVVRLMTLAKDQGDFELCSELARFMMGIDPRGDALRRVITRVGFKEKSTHLEPQRGVALGLGLVVDVPLRTKGKQKAVEDVVASPASAGEGEGASLKDGDGYFVTSPNRY